MTRLSREAPVLSVTVSESVMISRADLREGGALVWSVTHRGDLGPEAEPVIEGTPPPGYAALRAEMARAQAEDDGLVDHLFEVPVEFARGLCGFRHDAWVEPEGGFALLAPARRGLLARLLGR